MAMEMTGNAHINSERVWIPYKASFAYVKLAVDVLIESGIDVRLYNYPLCTVLPGYRMLCAKSISSWKVRYADVCGGCTVKNSCGGVFAGSMQMEKDEIEAVL